MTESRLDETYHCKQVAEKEVFMQGVKDRIAAICDEPYDIQSRTLKICMVCGNEEGKGHSDADCGGNGPRKQVIYSEVNAPGPWCKNGHRIPFA